MSRHAWFVRYIYSMRVIRNIALSTMLVCGTASAVMLVQESTTPASVPAPAHDDGQWPMPAKDFANTRYSGLSDITT